ncbi:MAG: zinc ribbon domain-containing protein [Pseudomonadota bacterium]|nr:zinc ribbon domain-containing protein [Pseudomonadota bacterium]|tara:strand:+ start:232 stop:495 length:264 start_codon:yes stop_codon:yes gene_type:complete
MPIYEYKCESCGYIFEELQKISDTPLKRCPKCQKETLKKQITAAGFKLKGSGWYETDFKNKKPSKESKSLNNKEKNKKPEKKKDNKD